LLEIVVVEGGRSGG
jgi:hypothetical protein